MKHVFEFVPLFNVLFPEMFILFLLTLPEELAHNSLPVYLDPFGCPYEMSLVAILSLKLQVPQLTSGCHCHLVWVLSVPLCCFRETTF